MTARMHPDDYADERNQPDALTARPLMRWIAIAAACAWIFTGRAAYDVAAFIQLIGGGM